SIGNTGSTRHLAAQQDELRSRRFQERLGALQQGLAIEPQEALVFPHAGRSTARQNDAIEHEVDLPYSLLQHADFTLRIGQYDVPFRDFIPDTRIHSIPGLEQHFSTRPVPQPHDEAIFTEIFDTNLRFGFGSNTWCRTNRFYDELGRKFTVGTIGDAQPSFDDGIAEGVVNDLTNDVFVRYGDFHIVF